MSDAKMTSKGQVTVPKDVRRKLNLKPGESGHIVTGRDPAAAET